MGVFENIPSSDNSISVTDLAAITKVDERLLSQSLVPVT